MKKAFENKNLLVIVFEIIVIALGIIGITYATSKILSDRTSTVIKTGEYAIDYRGEKTLNFTDISPINDNTVNINTSENVLRLEFSVKGAKQNKDTDLIYDVMLDNMQIDCSLLNKYTKWRLFKNGSLLNEGSLDPAFDGAVLTETMHLTTIQQDLPKPNQEYDDYVLIFWISESCDNLETCELIDQSAILDSNLSMNVFIALYGGEKVEYNRLASLDNSCANSPVLANNMVPITYKNGEWVVADKNNNSEEYRWYDYNNAIWANSAVVKNNSYEVMGTKIQEEDVLGYFVWIPRYRYKLWNATDEKTDSYNAYDNGIEIIFENGLNTKNSEAVNNNYLTHPVFSNNLKGIWVSKYEISKNDNNYFFVGDKEAYTGDTFTNYRSIIGGLNSTYNLGEFDIHIISNLEWGSALYLSHSKYGVCKHDGCDTISLNDSYIAGANKQDTLTRNVYGIYDMAGAASEYAAGPTGIGTATKEVTLANGNTWYNSLGLVSNDESTLRGGTARGMFYFGGISMSDTKYSTRSTIVSK